jgi:hypothetical protein
MSLEEIIEKIKKIIFQPTEFFESIKNEPGIIEAFKFFIIVSLVYLIFTLILFFVAPSILLGGLFDFEPSLGLSGGIGISLPIFIYIFLIVSTFVLAGVTHIIAILLGGKKDFSLTYKAVAYASTPSLLLGWIPFIGILANLYSLFLVIIGISKLHKVTLLRAFIIAISPAIILIILYFISQAFYFRFLLGTTKPVEKLPSGLENLPGGLGEFKLISIVASSCLPDGNVNIVIKNVGLSKINSKEISVVKDDVPLTYGQFTVDKTEISPGATATIKVPCTTGSKTGEKTVCRYFIMGMYYEVTC